VVLESFSLGFAAAVILGIADLIAAVVSRKMGLTRLLLWTHLAAVLVATPYLVLGADLHAVSLKYVALFGGLSVVVLINLVAFYKGLQIGPVALVSPIVSGHLVIVILLSAIVLGERLESVQMLGIGAAAVGIVVASMTVQDNNVGSLGLSKGVGYALITMFGAGIFVFALGALSREFGWFLPIYLVRVGSLILVLPAQLVVKNGPWWSPSPKLVLVAAMIGVLQFSGLAVYSLGAQIGSVSLVASTFSVYPLIPMLGGVLIFHEQLITRQTAGMATVLGGLMVLGLAS
jgi:drug/metabolite transporter (DMT)-like permease